LFDAYLCFRNCSSAENIETLNDMAKTEFLYHGTSRKNVSSIRENGLLPQIGEFTKRVYGSRATDLEPLVLLADVANIERVVHAMVAALSFEIEDSELDQRDIREPFLMDDTLFFERGALIAVKRSESIGQEGRTGSREPTQVEQDDYYSFGRLEAHEILEGAALREFFEEIGLVPSEVNDFVQPDSLSGNTPSFISLGS
jgi:hypothetical protein